VVDVNVLFRGSSTAAFLEVVFFAAIVLFKFCSYFTTIQRSDVDSLLYECVF
jgi:hypothetical protein